MWFSLMCNAQRYEREFATFRVPFVSRASRPQHVAKTARERASHRNFTVRESPFSEKDSNIVGMSSEYSALDKDR